MSEIASRRRIAARLLAVCVGASATLGAAGCSEPPQSDPEHDAIIAVVDDVFVALRNRDPAAWERLMHPAGTWFIQQIDENGVSQLQVDTTSARIAALSQIEGEIEEVNAAPEVFVDESIATFRSPYRASLNGELIACGTNAFQLVKIDDRWLIANILFTQRQCAPPE